MSEIVKTFSNLRLDPNPESLQDDAGNDSIGNLQTGPLALPTLQFCMTPAKLKNDYVECILTKMPESTCMVLTRKGEFRGCDRLAMTLINRGLSVIQIGYRMTELERLEALNRFKAGECNVLICDDVAIDGLDIPLVDIGIFYDIPKPNSEAFLRLIGRIDCAKLFGLGIFLVNQYEVKWFIHLENFIRKKLELFPAHEEVSRMLRERDAQQHIK